MKENPLIYEVNTVAWLFELSLKYGSMLTIGDIPQQEWDTLEELGFDYVWLMGVWKRSRAGITIFRNSSEWPPMQALFDSILPGWTEEDLVGSPYSIAAYEPDPMVGKWRDIEKAGNELHKRGMGLVLDFVPNHTAPDHPWVVEHPEYYFQGSEADVERDAALFNRIAVGETTRFVARGKDPFFPPWQDTAQLNYFNPALRAALIGELKKIAGYCDGVRCDMAMLVLNDIFTRNWGWANKETSHEPPKEEFLRQVRESVPGFILIAEAYWDTEWRLQQLGFDYVYDKRLYDRLRHSAPPEVDLHLKADMDYQKKLVRFIENHDEPRSADVFSSDKLCTAAVLISTLPGLRFYHYGQMEGKKIRIPVQLRRVIDEKPDQELRAFYERLLSIARQDIFHNGEWRLKEVQPFMDDSFHNLIAYTWKSTGGIKLVVINMGQNLSQGRIPLDSEDIGEREYLLHDELNNQEYIRSGKDMVYPGLPIILDGYGSHMFDIAAK